jgi:hypothetical protein
MYLVAACGIGIVRVLRRRRHHLIITFYLPDHGFISLVLPDVWRFRYDLVFNPSSFLYLQINQRGKALVGYLLVACRRCLVVLLILSPTQAFNGPYPACDVAWQF